VDTSTGTWTARHDAALDHAWAKYRTWAETSRRRKSQISYWRVRVLALSIAGAVLAAGGQQVSEMAIAAAIALALAAYFSREVLGEKPERQWIRARSAAEAIKSETYLFRTGLHPYAGDDAPMRLTVKIAELTRTVNDLPAEPLSDAARRARRPSGALSVDEYVRERVDDQIHRFYREKARQYEGKVASIRATTLTIGALAIVLGILGVGVTMPAVANAASAVMAVFTTITVSLAAYLYAGRFQHLIVSYQATARRLENLRVQWASSLDHGPSEAARFIHACEEAISVENSAWMAELTEQGEGDTTRAGAGLTPPAALPPGTRP
jgi:hypothetical protein